MKKVIISVIAVLLFASGCTTPMTSTAGGGKTSVTPGGMGVTVKTYLLEDGTPVKDISFTSQANASVKRLKYNATTGEIDIQGWNRDGVAEAFESYADGLSKALDRIPTVVTPIGGVGAAQ